MSRISHIVFVILLACFTLAAAPRAAATAPRPTAQNRLSDAEIERNIRTKLAKSKIGKDGFTVKVKGGVVSWEGTTNVMQHKGAATRMARTAGAVEVVNNIKISDAARAKAAGNLNGEIRRAEVKPN